MSGDLQDFEQFMKQREDASRAYVNGDGGPLSRILTRHSPATFFGPMGGYEHGAGQVASTHERGAAQFESTETEFEVLQMAASEGVAYCVGLQRATARMRGKKEAVPFNLRVTELFRQEDGEWKLVHRHADMLADAPVEKKPAPPAAKAKHNAEHAASR